MRGCRAGRRNRQNYCTPRDNRNTSKPDHLSPAKLDNAVVTMASLHCVSVLQAVAICCIIAFSQGTCSSWVLVLTCISRKVSVWSLCYRSCFASYVHKTLSISLTYFTLPVVEILSNDDCLSGGAPGSCPKIQWTFLVIILFLLHVLGILH